MLTHAEKVELIRGYLNACGSRIMVETGLYGGGGSGMNFAREGLLDLYVILDLSEENCDLAKQSFPDAWVICGDSAQTIRVALAQIHQPCLFWLDAHLVADIDTTEALDLNPCPLVGELEAIRAWPHAHASTILVDDVRLFGSYGWPTASAVHALTDGWQVAEADDVLRLTPLQAL